VRRSVKNESFSKHMKKLIISSLLAATSVVALGQGVLLEQGQSYVFEFTSIPDLRPAVSADPSQVIAWFEPSTFGRTTSALLEVFPNSLSDNPLSTTNPMVEYPDRVGLAIWWPTSVHGAQPPFFPDLQGVLRVTMLTGTAQLGGFEVDQVINGEFYSGYFSVPEPAASNLLAPALVWLVFSRMRRNRLAKVTRAAGGIGRTARHEHYSARDL
jgi:hypothetical protein